MLCRPRPNSNALNMVAISYKNPLCLTRAKQVQHALYNGHEIIKDNHTPAIVHNSEDTLEIAEITRKKMNDKMNDPECVTRKVKIAPHDYSKENLLATFTPQKQLTPEQIFWSNDLMKLKSEALEERTKVSRPIKAFTVITPTTITDGERGFEQTKACYLQEVIPFFKTLKDNFEGIQKALTKEVKEMKDVFEELEAEVAQYAIDRKLFCVATNSELNVARFTKMHVANTTAETRCLTLEAELANLRETNNHDNQKELINHFPNLSKATVNPQVSARDKHAIDVEPIVLRHRNNRDAHLDYLRHLKQSVETIRNIIKEAKKTNVPVPPSTGVNSYHNASGSQPKSHVKANRISPAKDKMADVNAPSGQTPTMAPPVRADDQILPHIRALLTIINLCLMGKTSGFERPRAPVLQILWGIVTRTNIDYAERIWEEFTQSIHTFIEDKRILSRHTSGKKRATLIVIPIIRFTKLIIHHLQRKHRSSPKSVGASEAEEVPTEEPHVADKDADYQKALEESMKDAYALPKGPLLPVVIREPESRKYQPLPEVPGKGKAKLTEEQSDNEEELEKVVLGAEEGGQDEGQAGLDPDAQAEDQTGSDAGAQAKGQAGSNPDETPEGQAGSKPDETTKGQAGPNPGDAEAKVQSISSTVVHAGLDREHMDLDVADVSPQPSTEQLDEGFTATVYPNVQENLKLAVEEPVLLEEPASSSGTLSSLQHLSRDFSFGD
nr:hypothetical protein [Tanacetum cinerariifolium]